MASKFIRYFDASIVQRIQTPKNLEPAPQRPAPDFLASWLHGF
jgi:hypothetical protein